MTITSSEVDYRLKLVEGDVIKTRVTSLGRDGAQVDTSLWSNVKTATLCEVSQNTSIALGSEVHATVTEIDSEEATLKRKRGLYHRNHLPGDQLRVQGRDRVSSALVQAIPDQFRNLDIIIVPGIAVEADATVELAKMRNGTAFALPVNIRDPGLAPNRTVTVRTTAGCRDATVKMLQFNNGDAQPSRYNPTITLSEPAPVTGQVTATLTTVTDDGIRGKLDWSDVSVPSVGTTVTTSVSQGQNRTNVNLDKHKIRIEFDHRCPVDGMARVKLDDRQDGVYRATLIRYTKPNLREGKSYQARVYETNDTARIKIDNRKMSIVLTHEVSTSGQATVEITDLNDAIYARIEDEIEPLTFDDAESGSDATDIDMTNLSKL